MIKKNLESLLGHNDIIMHHFERAANGAAMMEFLTDQSVKHKPNWRSRRLNGFCAHLLTGVASDIRRLYDSLQIKSFKGQKNITVYYPDVVDKRIVLKNKKLCNLYKASSMIDHSFRISAYSHPWEWISSAGAERIPDLIPEFDKLKIVIGESQKDGMYLFDLKSYSENLLPFLLECKRLWTFRKLRIDPRGAE